MANKWVQYDHTNYPPGGPEAATYLVDADELNQNYQDMCDAIGGRYIRGVACTDKNSVAGTCEIWLQADGGEKDVCDTGWYALIYYSTTHCWETTVQVSGTDCYISFGDGQCQFPAAPIGIADYSSAAFIDALHIILAPKRTYFPKTWIITADGAGGALQAADIIDNATGNSLATDVGAIKTRVDVALDGSGNLNAGVVTPTSLDSDAVSLTDCDDNILMCGDMQAEGVDEEHLFGVEDAGTPCATDIAVETTQTHGWPYSQKGVTTGTDQGFILPVNPHYLNPGAAGPLAGRAVSVSVWVYCSVENGIKIGINGSVGGYDDSVPAQNLTANTWTQIGLTKTFNAADQTYYLSIRSALSGATTFYFNEPKMNLGTTNFAFSASPYGETARVMMETLEDNLFYNGGFESWTLATQPDGWAFIGAPVMQQLSYAGAAAVKPYQGKSCVEVTDLDQDDGIRQYLGLVTGGGAVASELTNEDRILGLCRGRDVVFSVALKRANGGGSDPITIKINSYNGTDHVANTVEVLPPAFDVPWGRFYLTHTIQSDATQVYAEVCNRKGGSVDQQIYIDSAMFHVGGFPILYRPSTGWREMRWDFGVYGNAVSGEYMTAEGVGGGLTRGKYPIPETAHAYLILKAAARCLVAPAVWGIWTLAIDGAGGNAVTITNPALEGDNHIDDYTATAFECTDSLDAPVYTGGGGANECTDTVFSAWGYYWAG